MLGVTTNEYFKFNEHVANIPKRVSRKFNALTSISSLLSYQHKKKFYQTLSKVCNSITVLLAQRLLQLVLT